MKKVLIAAIFVLLLAIASPVFAGNVETAAAVFFNIGDEKRPVEATLVLQDDSGKVLSPNQGIVEVENGRTLFGQVFINGATDRRKFDVRWSTMALVSDQNLCSTQFDSQLGWTFDVRPEEYSQPGNAARALTIWVRAFGAKRGYVRVVFKISPGFMAGSVFTTSQLILKVVPRSVDQIGANDGIKQNFAQIQGFSNVTADKVNNLEQRVQSLESWAGAAAGSRNQQIQPSQTSAANYSFHVSVNGRDYNGVIWLRLYDGPNVQPKQFKCRGPMIPMLNASAGKYIVEYSFDGKEWGRVGYEISNSPNQIVELGGR